MGQIEPTACPSQDLNGAPLDQHGFRATRNSWQNLTITVDDEVLKSARIRALEQGTSVNAILAEHLRAFAGKRESQAQALNSLCQLALENAQGGKQRAQQRGRRRWTREELHERR